MYTIVKNVIQTKSYDLSELIKKIDTFWVQGSLTDEEKEELKALARKDAASQNSVDIMKKLEEFDKRLTKLENRENTPAVDEDAVEEYVNGKWYYTGNRVIFEEGVYECIAPEGVICVWSPKDYPTFWKEV